MTSDYCIALTTFADQESAEKVIDILLDAKLAACIQVFPIQSYYRWEGKVQNEPERLVYIKTKSSLFEEVKETILKHHPYDVPEIVRLPINGGHQAYLSWIDEECR